MSKNGNSQRNETFAKPIGTIMPGSLFLIFNHEITPVQENDARSSLGIVQIRCLPPDLKELWRQIPPDLTEISSYLEPIKNWLARQGQGQNLTMCLSREISALVTLWFNLPLKRALFLFIQQQGGRLLKNSSRMALSGWCIILNINLTENTGFEHGRCS